MPEAPHPRSSVLPRARRGPAPCDRRGMRGMEPGVSLPNIYVFFLGFGMLAGSLGQCLVDFVLPFLQNHTSEILLLLHF